MPEVLKKIFESDRMPRVLVVGDIILDEYIWGSVERISPEAPVKILDSKAENMVPGGAANVANNLAAMGCETILCGAVGRDEKGGKLLDLIKKIGIDCSGVLNFVQRPTTNKIRVIAHNQQILRIDKEDRSPIQAETEEKIIEFIHDTVPQVDGIICSDYNKGILAENVLKAVIHRARQHRKQVILDPKGLDFSKYNGVHCITPNEKEVERACPIKIQGEEDLERAVQYLFGLIKAEAILVTRGKDGMSLFEEGGKKSTKIDADAREVFDVTGAGDTTIAVFGMALFYGFDYLNAARLANMAAGIVVGKVGTSVVTREELNLFLTEGKLLSSRNILSQNELQQVVCQAKSMGKKVVFTNGCFDILHGGHIEFLQQARSMGDFLVVGINSDSSVKGLKGSGRPIKTQTERASILAALKYVDAITIFSEPTPYKLISELKPDVLVKGSDYKVDEVVGKDIVEGYGGKVKLVQIVEGLSTTRLVEKIRNNNKT
ncbi:MAG: D-glycero-beta-D-manno-heptose-7-phosphate kinase [Nitrospinae bacterium]|nr:D-glycero-beta-D-manno-heptose-7-phosphate kinase [Nitrospinota bacterium]